MKTEYDTQAETFLSKHGIKLAIKLSNRKDAPWQPAGHHYRVTLSKNASHRLPDREGKHEGGPIPAKHTSFNFWGSAHDAVNGTHPSPYDVLACISGDIHCPETFADFCAEYGYDEDSRKAEQVFRRASAFSRSLRAFFTDAEQEALSEIQ